MEVRIGIFHADSTSFNDAVILAAGRRMECTEKINQDIPYFDKLYKVRQMIQKNPEENWKIQQMADEVSLSPAYFQVLYKKAFGVTCMTDVIQTKVAATKEYLLSTDMSVASIAEELGYAQVYHFIRQFKKYAGLTPGLFVKLCANKVRMKTMCLTDETSAAANKYSDNWMGSVLSLF